MTSSVQNRGYEKPHMTSGGDMALKRRDIVLSGAVQHKNRITHKSDLLIFESIIFPFVRMLFIV